MVHFYAYVTTLYRFNSRGCCEPAPSKFSLCDVRILDLDTSEHGKVMQTYVNLLSSSTASSNMSLFGADRKF